jgi:2-oxoisovalerate dehydrogenase E1 component alpha subunit
VRVDGNDVLATYKVVREAVERAARGEGPTLVEMLTYRLGGHSTSDDPRAYRVQDEVEQWRKTDPILRTRKHLDAIGAWNDAEDERIRKDVDAEIKAAVESAEKKAAPALSTMFSDVFREQPWHLREQEQECTSGPRAKGHGH